MVGEKAMEIGDFGKESRETDAGGEVKYEEMNKSEKLGLFSFFFGAAAGADGFLALAMWMLVFAGTASSLFIEISEIICLISVVIFAVLSIAGIATGAMSLSQGAGVNKGKAIFGLIGGLLFWLFIILEVIIALIFGTTPFF